MIAYVDESLRSGVTALYLVAAVVTANTDRTDDTARAVLLPGQRRFHWRGESERQRIRMLEGLVGLEAVTLAYACRPAPRTRQDRARAQCLKRLLWDLRDRAVDELVIESREDHNDAKDRRTIVHAQRAQVAPKALAYRFARPRAEPGLWLADAAAGAVAASVADGVHRYIGVLAPWVTVTDVAL